MSIMHIHYYRLHELDFEMETLKKQVDQLYPIIADVYIRSPLLYVLVFDSEYC